VMIKHYLRHLKQNHWRRKTEF